MGSSIWIDTINLGWFIVHSRLKISNYDVFLADSKQRRLRWNAVFWGISSGFSCVLFRGRSRIYAGKGVQMKMGGGGGGGRGVLFADFTSFFISQWKWSNLVSQRGFQAHSPTEQNPLWIHNCCLPKYPHHLHFSRIKRVKLCLTLVSIFLKVSSKFSAIWKWLSSGLVTALWVLFICKC